MKHYQVYLTIDPKTRVALYGDQQTFMGIFDSMSSLATTLKRPNQFLHYYNKGLKMDTPNYDNLHRNVKDLIGNCTDDACHFVNDMCVTLDESIDLDMVIHQTECFVQSAIDPHYCAIELPDTIKKAIAEYVHKNVGFKII